MSKIIINVKTLNLTVAGAQRSVAPSELIGTLIHSIFAGVTAQADDTATGSADETTRTDGLNPNVAAPYGEDTGAGGEEAQSNASDAPASLDAILDDRQEFTLPMVLNHDNVLIVLRSDERYTKRTVEAVARSFPEETVHAVAYVLNQMVADGKVKQLTRRSDRVALFEAVAAAAVTPAAPTTQAENTTETAVGSASEQPAAPALTADNLVAFLKGDERYQYRTEAAIVKHFAGHGADEVRDLIDSTLDDQVETKRRRHDGVTLYYALA